MEPKTEMQKNAIESARIQKQKTYQRALDIQWLNSRMEDSGMGRLLAQIQREAEMEREFQERTDHAALVNARAEKETALGIAIANEHREEMCKVLRRMHLRERDPELRELTRKLTAGYVCRDLKQQILHNQYKKHQEKAQDTQANDVLSNALYLDKEAFDKEQQDQAERSKKYCQELQQQLVNRQRQKQCEYEDMLIEKKMLEDVLRTIADEDQRELQQKRDQMEKYRKESDAFRKVREAWKQKQKELVIMEERQIEEQAKLASDRTAEAAAKRTQKLRERELLNEKIAEQIMADESEKREREDIIKQLQEQEFLEKHHLDDIAEKNKLEMVKIDTTLTLRAQIDARRRVEREERRKAEAYRTSVEEKMSAEFDIERQREKQQRDKKKKYQQELREQIADNAKRREVAEALEKQRVQSVWEYHRDRENEVEVERQSIVREHVPHVLGFMQAGALRRGDLPRGGLRGPRGPGGPGSGGPALPRPQCTLDNSPLQDTEN